MRTSPLKQLTAEDIARKQKKLGRIDKRIERKDDKFKDKVASGKKGTDMDITRHERSLQGLKERKHKTEHQINTGERGRPTSLKNEAWLAGPSRKSALTDEEKKRLHAVSSINYDKVVSSGGVDLGTIKSKNPVSNYKDGYYGVERKSALHMLGITPKSPLNNGDLDFDVDYSGAKPVDVGSAKKTDRSKKIQAIKEDVREPGLEKERDYFDTNPTEGSDNMAVRIQDAKNITKAGGPYPKGITNRGEHYTRVEKPLQEELSENMLLKKRNK